MGGGGGGREGRAKLRRAPEELRTGGSLGGAKVVRPGGIRAIGPFDEADADFGGCRLSISAATAFFAFDPSPSSSTFTPPGSIIILGPILLPFAFATALIATVFPSCAFPLLLSRSYFSFAALSTSARRGTSSTKRIQQIPRDPPVEESVLTS